jgi:hypothetical protein
MKILSILILLPFISSSHHIHNTNEKTMLRRNKSEDYLDNLEIEKTNYKRQLRSRIYNDDDKSKIWSIEPRMDIIPDNISEKEKNKLATGIFFSSFALSFPMLCLFSIFLPNSEL